MVCSELAWGGETLQPELSFHGPLGWEGSFELCSPTERPDQGVCVTITEYSWEGNLGVMFFLKPFQAEVAARKFSPSVPATTSALVRNRSRMGGVPTPAGCRQASSSTLRAHPSPLCVRKQMP